MTEHSHYVWQRRKSVHKNWEPCTEEDVSEPIRIYLTNNTNSTVCDKDFMYRRIRMPGKEKKA